MAAKKTAANKTVSFQTTLLRFEQQGEKTGWTYIDVPGELAQQLKPGNKKSFRVKGKLDNYKIKGVALIPMGSGNFIMAVNAVMRKGIGKREGAMVNVLIETDNEPLKISAEFLECLNDEPVAKEFFYALAKGHQNYFSKWIDSAKTENTKAKRIAQAVTALSRGWGFPEMVRAAKKEKDELL